MKEAGNLCDYNLMLIMNGKINGFMPNFSE